MTRTISNSDNVIDSRDVIARIEELEDKAEAIETAKTDLAEFDPQDCGDHEDAAADARDKLQEALDDAEADFDEDEREELKTLKSLADDAEGYAEDWRHGSTLIHEDYFVEYCRELVVDIGDLPKNIPSYLEIDWDKTADNLRADYTSVEFGDATYWVR